MARILSIEDDPSIQQIVSTALNLEGHEVDYAFSGEEGYQKIFSKRPDLVILDMMLPGMSGADVLKALHSHPALKGIPVLVVTAYGGAGRHGSVLEQTVRALGAVEYLTKPFRVAELTRRVKTCLANRPPAEPPGREVVAGDVRLDTRLKSVFIHDRHVTTLPDKRFELLSALVEANAPVSKEDLMRRLWGTPDGNLAALEKNVSRLRVDLGPHAFRLRTTTGGYDFVTVADKA